MKSKIYIFALFLVLILSGCAGSDILQAVEATPTPQPLIEDWRGTNTTISVPVPTDMESTNPYFVTKTDSLNIYNLIYEPLIKLSEANEPTPCLAQSWRVDEEGTTWTFIIRDGVYWHNSNRELNAQDVIYTLDLMQAAKDDSIHCRVMGYIKDWVRLDDRTVQLETYEPFYGVLMAMNFPILPYDAGYTAFDAVEFQPAVPIGTGPYYVSDYRPGTRVELEINENWWKTLPEIETIIGEPYDDPSLALSALTLGQIDVMSTDETTASQLRETGSINAFEYTTNYYEFLMPNIDGNILLRDVKVRQAIALALNRQEIISNVYVNHAVITEAPVQPSSWLYEGTAAGYDQDIEEARRLLILAGWKMENPEEDIYYNISPDGIHADFELDLMTNSSEYDSLRYETAIIIAKQLGEIGIKVNIKTVEWDMFGTRINEGYYDLLLAGWYIDELPDLRSLFSLDGINNLSGYSSEEMDELLDAVMKSSTEEDLRNNFMQIQIILMEDVPIISLYFRSNTLLTRAGIVNVSDIKDANVYNTIQEWNVID